MEPKLYLLIIFSLMLILVSTVVAIIYKKKMQYWIIGALKRSLLLRFVKLPKEDVHIMFAFVDHFEPGNGGVDLGRQIARVNAWTERYPKIAMKHRDSDGICPQHTFFYPPHYDIHDHLMKIVDLCTRGFGEVEMHLHHDRQEPWLDDASSLLKKKIYDCIDSYSRYGIFCLPDGRRKYAFIHGDWALANSLKGGKHCGVNDELSVLMETGCYADFTFPVSNEAQPKLANTIFYAQSTPAFPKGYNKIASPVKVDNKNPGGLMLIQGIIGLRWKSRTHKEKPSIEQSNIDVKDFPFKSRVNYWVDKRIQVKGRPNWIFIKIHTHGAREVDWETLFGKPCDDMFRYLETKYNDGKKYFLHYVSAREMYNIIRAAEDGKDGSPNDYRDYEIPRYIYLTNKRSAPPDKVKIF